MPHRLKSKKLVDIAHCETEMELRNDYGTYEYTLNAKSGL